MELEKAPEGQYADGNGLVLFVPTVADVEAPTLAELGAGTVKELTYSLTADGFRDEVTENAVESNRYTMRDTMEGPGTIKDTLELQYVNGSIAEDTLERGVAGFVVRRMGLPRETPLAAGQKVTVWPIRAGLQRQVAPTANSELSKAQKQFITGPVGRDVAIAA